MVCSKKTERIDIYISYVGTQGLCPVTAKPSPVYDYRDNHHWHHLNFLQSIWSIHCRVPRVNSSVGVKTIKVPWADQYDHFTHAFAGHAAKVLRSTKNKTQTAHLLQCSFRIIQRIMDREAGCLLSERSSIVPPPLRIDEKAFKPDFQSFLSNIYH